MRAAASIHQMLWLASAGANVNARDSSHYTPLLLALSPNTQAADPVGMVTALCELGADTNCASDPFYGDAPLHFAARLPDVRAAAEIISVLLKHHAHVHARNHAGCTPLHVAARCGNEAAIRTLYLGGSRVDAGEGYCSYTPLHLAVMGSSLETVQALVECGATIGQPDAFGMTSVDRCQSDDAKRLLDCSRLVLVSLEHLCLHAIREAVRNNATGLDGFRRLALPFGLKNQLLFEAVD